MTRKIDPETKNPEKKPKDWPGIEGRSQEDEAEFEHDGKRESAADVTEAQRDLERAVPRKEPGE